MSGSLGVIENYFPELNQQFGPRFKRLFELYSYWNEKINVISRKDMENFFEHHLSHALAFTKFSSFTDGSHILDVGTGGGIPGIPLAIIYPNCQFTLIDGRGKKIKVATEICTALDLVNVEAKHLRTENMQEKFDVITGRAVTSYPEFLKMIKHLRKPSSEVFYWTGGSYKSFKNVKGTSVYQLDTIFKSDFYKDKFILKHG